jgi:hypothetical protein
VPGRDLDILSVSFMLELEGEKEVIRDKYSFYLVVRHLGPFLVNAV